LDAADHKRVSRAAGSKRRVTLEDVARHAGVSRATVSRVVTGVGRVSDRTRAQVEQVIVEIGYRPDIHARSLAGGPTGVVGVLVDCLASSYVTQILHHFDAALAVNDLQLMLCSTSHRGSLAEYVSHLTSGVVDGLLILIPAEAAPFLGDLQQRRFPHVLVDVDDPGVSPAITFDNEGGISAAIHHLLSLGHRRFGFVTGDLRSAAARERHDAFMRTLQVAGTAAADQMVAEGDWSEQSGYAAGIRLLSSPQPPTAIVVSNDLEGLGMLRAARERGVPVPADLSIVGCDDIPEAAAVHPSLTTVRQPLSEIGRVAAMLLHEQIVGPGSASRGTQLSAQLVVRETTAAVPVRGAA
jgi:LacI family transcriptional regulator